MKDADRKKEIEKLYSKQKELRRQYNRKYAQLQNTINKLISQCLHNQVVRHSDPSGGNDHAYECLVCGKEW